MIRAFSIRSSCVACPVTNGSFSPSNLFRPVTSGSLSRSNLPSGFAEGSMVASAKMSEVPEVKLLVPQSFDGIEARRLPGRVVAEYHANRRGHGHRRDDGGQ